MRNTFAGFLLLTVFLGGCESSLSERKITAYYDIEGLFREQARLLQDKPILKAASIDDAREEKQLKFDSTSWAKELSMFVGMDINKTALVGAFEEGKSSAGNGQTITYTKKEGAETGVQWIKLEQDGSGNVVAFSGAFEEQNALYQNQRELFATFNVNKGISTISSYRITGYQKILMKDTVNYHIEATIGL